MPRRKIKWQNPLELAQKISANYGDEDWVFLYSGLSNEVNKSRSIIALFPQEKIITDDFFAAEKILKKSDKKWFGYFSYEVAQQFEKLPKTKKSFVNLPKIYLLNFAVVLEFDHEKEVLMVECGDEKKFEQVKVWTPSFDGVTMGRNGVQTKNLKSNFTDQTYLKTIEDIRKKIAQGDFYQTNLTRKFFGEFAKKPNDFDLFTQLTKLSPANYSAFLKLGKNSIISSSPELFFEIEKGQIISRPIKGTAPRSSNAKDDLKNKNNLKNSAKERAENLMIVDLVRNDLARICQAGSVATKKLFEITSYQNIHHMSSEIHGKLAKNSSIFDALRACFPPGSMTGTPKIKAMEIAAQKEKIARGIYSGAIGFFDKNSANFSVVIRTLILRDKKFEFQVGGAITFDSDPKAELQEIFNKAKAISQLLNLNLSK